MDTATLQRALQDLGVDRGRLERVVSGVNGLKQATERLAELVVAAARKNDAIQVSPHFSEARREACDDALRWVSQMRVIRDHTRGVYDIETGDARDSVRLLEVVSEPHQLPNGRVQGGPEDRAHWWTCAVCGFTGPFVGEREDGKKGCTGSCGGVRKNPETTFERTRPRSFA